MEKYSLGAYYLFAKIIVGFSFVAETAGGNLAGLLIAHQSVSAGHNHASALVLVVGPQWRGLGVGNALLEKLESVAGVSDLW